MEAAIMPLVKLREKGQVTIPAEILQEWRRKNHVAINDSIEATLVNGVLMLIPKNRQASRRDMMSFAGIGKGLWGKSQEEADAKIEEIRTSWTR